SKHRVCEETLSLLLALAEASRIQDAITDLVTGAEVNRSERRAALHTVLRVPRDGGTGADPAGVAAQVHAELARMLDFARRLDRGEIRAASGAAIDSVIHIGIGGSDLGPRLAVEALCDAWIGETRLAFVSNVHDRDLFQTLQDFDPNRTLFIVASKSFTTMETATNADSARHWLAQGGCRDFAPHFVAVTANVQAARSFGIAPEHTFKIWDWVGGRYSVWSSVGLPLALKIGEQGFQQFLAGGHAVDVHFRDTPLSENLPVILGLLDIWYGNFFGAETLAVVPYDQRLRLFPEDLSQLMMESNGKSVDNGGGRVAAASSPIVWGSIGTNAQHAYFQLLHQGTHLVPVDFLAPGRARYDTGHQRRLLASCLAQSRALMIGRDNALEPHKHFPGNRPSTTILYDDLTPYTLGMLLALYEHRTYVQAVIWNINPFDQWGVELGKTLTGEVLSELEGGAPAELDSSTRQLLNHLRTIKGAES
ncbi:MAG: glucose-6-phosphate isomerase, partial [Gammaproteobacteria bacterium]|nr:glucose-6-phosphate isomerase [Gammaproteobacteria bacterium]